MKTRKALSLLVVLSMLIGMITIPAMAEEGEYTAEIGAQLDGSVNGGLGEWGLSESVSFSEGIPATITVEFDSPAKFGGNYLAIDTDFPTELTATTKVIDAAVAQVLSVEVDGNEVPVEFTILNKEGKLGGMRLTLCNEWASDIETQPISGDDLVALGEFTKLEITFVFGEYDDDDGEPAEPGEPGMDNFKANMREYDDRFTDIADDGMGNWVKTMFTFNIMDGTSATTFSPVRNMTFAEVITVAAKMSAIYNGEFNAFKGAKYPDDFVAYAVENDIIEEGEYDDVLEEFATRADMVNIWVYILPEEEWDTERNTFNSVSDVDESDGPIILFYQAGIVRGNADGTFGGADNVTREQCAVMLARIADPEYRLEGEVYGEGGEDGEDGEEEDGVIDINASLTYTGTEGDPGYVFDSADYNLKGEVKEIIFNIVIDPDLDWNDWCAEYIVVTVGGESKGYAFGGKEVGWSVELGDLEIGGAKSDDWLGSVSGGKIAITVPVGAEEFTIAFYDNCHDKALDVTHFTIVNAEIVYA